MAPEDNVEPEDNIEPEDNVEPEDEGAQPGIDEDTGEPGDDDSDFAPPFIPKTFGGAFVWARGQHFVATVLRVREGGNVVVSTQHRRDMQVMLTGGRAVLEVGEGDDIDRVELIPASPVAIDPGMRYRLIAVTEVELFTVYEPLPAA
jgi:hypothetical protein